MSHWYVAHNACTKLPTTGHKHQGPSFYCSATVGTHPLWLVLAGRSMSRSRAHTSSECHQHACFVQRALSSGMFYLTALLYFDTVVTLHAVYHKRFVDWLICGPRAHYIQSITASSYMLSALHVIVWLDSCLAACQKCSWWLEGLRPAMLR